MPSSPSSRSTANRPLYAIDFTAVACGKRIANTKRRVRWRFGFANPDALSAGETGTACRGEEHDITLVWSVTSGKRLILADGQEVHYSNSRSAVIDFSWTMRGNHVLKVVAHATAPMSVDPGFRQYDFFVDGRSFFTFPKVYRLGLTGGRTMSPDGKGSRMAEGGERRSANIATIEAPHNHDEEEAYLREAIKASLADEEARKEKGEGGGNQKISSEGADLLIDFMDDYASSGNTLPPAPAPADNWAMTPVPQQTSQWAQPPVAAAANDNWAMAAAVSQPPVQQQQQYAAAPSDPFGSSYTASVPNFASPPPQQQSVVQSQTAPAPFADPFASQQFAQPSPVPVPAPAPAVYGQDPFASPAPQQPPASDPFAPQPPAPFAAPAAQPPAQQQPATNMTMNSLNGTDGLLGTTNGADTGGTMADKALQNLMGSIDSFGITGSAAKPPANNPFDSNNIMSNATLGEIKSARAPSEKKPVMNSPPGGALVPVASQGGNWGGYGQQNQSQFGGMGGSMPPQYPIAGGYGQQQQMGYGQGMQQQPGMGMGQPMNQQQQQQPPMGMGQSMPQQQQFQWGQQQPPNWGAPSYQ